MMPMSIIACFDIPRRRLTRAIYPENYSAITIIHYLYYIYYYINEPLAPNTSLFVIVDQLITSMNIP